jgi:hypothetical protein
MVKKNSNFKFRASEKKSEKKPRKIKSSFIPYDESLFSSNEDNTDDLVRTYLRDTGGYRGSSSSNYFNDEDNNSIW